MPRSVAFSKFIEAKVRTWFKLNNMKKDGVMGTGDFADMANMFIKEFKPTEAKATNLRKWLTEGWQILIKEGRELGESGSPGGLTDANAPVLMEIQRTLDGGNKITEDQYVNAYGQLIQVNVEIFEKHFRNMVGTFFDVFDTDSDGFIVAEEMVRGLKVFGIDQADAVKMIFNELDIKKCGKVAKEDYLAAWVEFMAGEDKNATIAKFLCRA